MGKLRGRNKGTCCMITAISSVLLIGCQGCAPVVASPQNSQPATYRLTSTAQDQTEPLLAISSSLSVSQNQTTTSPQISIKPVIGEVAEKPVAIGFLKPADVTALRVSSAPAVVDYERQRNVARITTPSRQVKDFD